MNAEQASAVLDITVFYYGCAACRALENSVIAGTEMSTWSGIKALYDTQ